jgi:acetyl-CoA acetyltransferase
MSTPIAIAGIGELKPARFLDGELDDLAVAAIELAVADAGLSIGDIDGIICESTFMFSVQSTLAATLGLAPDVFLAQAGGAGMGIIGAPRLAQLAIDAGLATNVVCFYASKLGSMTEAVYDYHAEIPHKATFELPFGFFPQVAYMAAMANRYMAQYGYDADDFWPVVNSQRQWASMNPLAVKPEVLSLDAYRAKPMVADPLRTADCSLKTDGAMAYVMTSSERARDLRHRVVEVVSCAVATEAIAEHSHLSVRPDLTTLPSRLAGPAALRSAGLATADIDVIELYDCFSIIPVIQLEDIGFCGRGEALARYRAGDMRPGGPLPVNTHGGLLCHSYLLSGNHLVEAVRQLRGDSGQAQLPDARTALVTAWNAQEHATLVVAAG